MGWSRAKRNRAKKASTMTKRNKKQVRRLRHAKRLSKITSDARERAERMKPNDDVVLAGSERYGIDRRLHTDEALIFYESFTDRGRGRYMTQSKFRSVPSGLLGAARWAGIADAVDVVPIVLQATLRGRRLDQMHAEMRENRARIRHRDIR